MAEFGVRGHDFGTMDTKSLAGRIAAAGFTRVQLAPAKALSDFPGSAGVVLSLEMETAFAHRVSRVFADAGVGISVLGCYVDPLNPDPGQRALEDVRFRRAVSLATAYGAGMVATETSQCLEVDARFAELEKIVEGWARWAEERHVRIAIEPVFGHTVSDPRKARQLLLDITSPALGIVFDPANLVNPADPASQASLFGQAIDLLGDRIMAVHAKDFLIDAGKKVSTIPGKGIMDWKAALGGYANLPLFPAILIEDQKPLDLAASRSFIEAIIEDGG